MQGTSTPVSGGQSSIQVLLDAEKEASREVQAARQYRVERLKAARTEAETEIEALKVAKKEEFSAFERSIVAGLDEEIAEQNRITETELQRTLELSQQNRQTIINLLIEKVLKVQPTIHPNVTLHLSTKK